MAIVTGPQRESKDMTIDSMTKVVKVVTMASVTGLWTESRSTMTIKTMNAMVIIMVSETCLRTEGKITTAIDKMNAVITMVSETCLRKDKVWNIPGALSRHQMDIKWIVKSNSHQVTHIVLVLTSMATLQALMTNILLKALLLPMGKIINRDLTINNRNQR